MSAAWTPSPRPVRRLSVHCRSLCQWFLDMDTKCAPFFLWGTWLEKQAETIEGYLSSELGVACRSQIIDLDRYRGSGHRFCACTVNPKNFICFVLSAVLHFTSFPFFLFFFSSVVALHAQTLNNVGPLDCKFRLLRRRSLLSLGGKISVAEVMHLLTLNVFAANFRVVLVVVTFFLSFSLWWIWRLLLFF